MGNSFVVYNLPDSGGHKHKLDVSTSENMQLNAAVKWPFITSEIHIQFTKPVAYSVK